MADHHIDHVGEALGYASEVDSINPQMPIAKATVAQVHATLALVEQQRIANLIAFLGTRSPSPETQGRIRDEIRKGLGL